MRRSDKVLGSDVAKQILAAGEYGVLSTVDADGQAYGVPLNYSFIDSTKISSSKNSFFFAIIWDFKPRFCE